MTTTERTHPGRAAAHPCDVLQDEHQVILAVLGAIERLAAETARTGVSRLPFWRRASEFFESFADRCHHGKEEDMLFPALTEHGMPAGHGPIAVMLAEHAEGRARAGRLRAAGQGSDARALQQAALAYADWLRQHIEKEDGVLFPMARNMLPAPVAKEMLARFERFEHEVMGATTHCQWLRVARELCEEAGVPFEVESRPTPFGGGCGCRHG